MILAKPPRQFGVIYLLTQIELAARLVVSLRSLRQFYTGPITLFTTRDESHAIGQWCADDARLGVLHAKLSEVEGPRYQSAYLTKVKLTRHAPYRDNLFLDADTLIVNRLDDLIHAVQASSLTVTNFLAMNTMQRPFADQLRSWRNIPDSQDVPFSIRARAKDLLSLPYPAINVGVFGFRRKASFLQPWLEIAKLGKHLRTPDETALQLMLPDWDHCVLNQEFNLFPSSPPAVTTPRIWHFANNSHLTNIAKLDVWKTAYDECHKMNIARLQQWSRVTSTIQSSDG